MKRSTSKPIIITVILKRLNLTFFIFPRVQEKVIIKPATRALRLNYLYFEGSVSCDPERNDNDCNLVKILVNVPQCIVEIINSQGLPAVFQYQAVSPILRMMPIAFDFSSEKCILSSFHSIFRPQASTSLLCDSVSTHSTLRYSMISLSLIPIRFASFTAWR